MKKIAIWGAIAALLPTVAFAAYIGTGNSVTAPSPQEGGKPVSQNVYLVGGTINVSNPIAGDLTAAGGTIIISGKVERDITVAGGNISIIGSEAEDIRIAGGNLTIGGKINGEIMAAGGQVNVTADTNIARDSYIAGGTLVFAGTENGNLTLAGGDIRIDGVVNGNLTVKHAQKITFGPQAVVKGTVEYSAPQEATIESGAQLSGTPVFHKIENSKQRGDAKPFVALFGIMFILKTIAVLAAAYLLWYLRRSDMNAVIDSVHKHFWSVLFRGFAVLILIPIAGIILLFTVVGWIPAGVMFASYITLLLLTTPVSVILATSLIMALAKKSKMELTWYHILMGAIVLALIGLVPFIGWLACFVIFLASLGAVAGILKARFSTK